MQEREMRWLGLFLILGKGISLHQLVFGFYQDSTVLYSTGMQMMACVAICLGWA